MATLDHSSLKHWLDKGWKTAESTEHVLGGLQGRPVGQFTLVVLLGPKNRFGATYFQIFLRNSNGETSDQPVILGLHSSGLYPSYNWIEIISFSPHVTFRGGDGLAQQLFQYLADLIPPGGHMMIEYDSPEQEETTLSLALGMPPASTPLGYLLFSIGCGAGFKDWHFAEGGSEGPRKLQGYKALNMEYAQLRAKELVQDLRSFLATPLQKRNPELEDGARRRALSILEKLQSQDQNLARA